MTDQPKNRVKKNPNKRLQVTDTVVTITVTYYRKGSS